VGLTDEGESHFWGNFTIESDNNTRQNKHCKETRARKGLTVWVSVMSVDSLPSNSEACNGGSIEVADEL
jgi:hypothetical protein